MVKTCVQCGREFEPRHNAETLCSDTCRRKRSSERCGRYYHRLKNPKVVTRRCVVCGREFIPEKLPRCICSEECKKIRIRQYSVTYWRRHRTRLMQKNQPRAENYLDYLAHLEETYGYADDGTIRAAIDSWFEGRN